MTTLSKNLRAVRSELAPVLSTARGCDWSRVRVALRTAFANPTAKRIRVYSGAGFVPNSYRWRCMIQFVEVHRTPEGLRVSTNWTGAQRSGARGSLVVVK